MLKGALAVALSRKSGEVGYRKSSVGMNTSCRRAGPREIPAIEGQREHSRCSGISLALTNVSSTPTMVTIVFTEKSTHEKEQLSSARK